jgi:hypothetical protein
LSELARGILCPVLHMFDRSLVSGCIRLRLTLMVLLSAIWLVLLLVVFSRSKVMIMMIFLLMLLIRPLFTLFLWSISQFDIKNVFLNSELREDVYIHPPPGYSVPKGMVCHLRRSLYGLKQAHRAWFQHFTSVVTTAGFSTSAHDSALFVHMSPRSRTLLLLYVEDVIITGDDPEYIAFIKAHLSDQFLCLILVLLDTSLGLRSPPYLRGSFCLKRSIFMIFLIKLLLSITGLLRLPWSSMFTLNPLMVSLLRIILVIVIL